ncbi:MAG: hypothetical protein KM296_00650 [Brockia lithotrophica]|nr:hypothetical protein [Brockia lithotrophica]
MEELALNGTRPVSREDPGEDPTFGKQGIRVSFELCPKLVHRTPPPRRLRLPGYPSPTASGGR